nr:hypothetical protein [Tanacetum cinerariifolium]
MVQNVQGRQYQGYTGSAGKNQALGAKVVNKVGNAGTNQPRVVRCYNHNDEENFRANHVDAYDSDYDEEATTNAIFMASLSSIGSINDDTAKPRYDSNILFEAVSFRLCKPVLMFLWPICYGLGYG